MRRNPRFRASGAARSASIPTAAPRAGASRSPRASASTWSTWTGSLGGCRLATRLIVRLRHAGPLPSQGRLRSASCEGGFTLIEVVVAFVMLALILSVSFEIFSRGMARAGDLDDRAKALAVAQSRLAATGAEEVLREGVWTGESEDHRFQWQATVRRAEDLATGPGGKTPSAALVLHLLHLHVTWRGAVSHDLQLDPDNHS